MKNSIDNKGLSVTKASSEDISFFKQLEIPLLIRVLKEHSCKDCPLSARKISDELSLITGLEHSEKTVLRKLQKLIFLQREIDDSLAEKNLYLALGGKLMEVYGKSKTLHRPQARYYFEPLLDQSDVDMICGTITSNRYLTQKEKEYLISRQQTLAYGDRYLTNDAKLPEKPAKRAGGSARVLSVVNVLHDALNNCFQVEIIYGRYEISAKNSSKVELKPRNLHKPYVLNPYALLWNDGEYYLLATHRGHTNLSHFRVDRIMSVILSRDPEDARKTVPREKIPDELAPFFKKVRGKYEFLDEKYTTTYPMMAIYGEKDICTCTIDCKSSAIGVVVDYFGTDIRILPPQLVHKEGEKDVNGRPVTYVGLRLPPAQYDNVKSFCLLQQDIVTAVSPFRLVSDVAEKLKEEADKYKKIEGQMKNS